MSLGAIFALVGVLSGRQAPVLWGGLLVLIVVVAWASVLAVFLALRAHALAITLHAHAAVAAAGGVATISMIVEARRRRAPRAVTATLSLPPGLESAPVSFDFESRARTEFEIPVMVYAAGIHVVRGVALTFTDALGLWASTVDCPRPVVIRARPRATGVSARFASRFTNPSEGDAKTARRGDSPTFSDIDPYRPGDPLRRIAWTASLRHRRLLVKRTEEPEVTPVAIVVDASVGMRRGPEGTRAIDVAVSRAASLVRTLGRARIPVALVVFHRRIVARLPLARTEERRSAAVDTLSRLPSLIDPSLHRIDEDRLVNTVHEALLAIGVPVSARASAADLARAARRWMEKRRLRAPSPHPNDVNETLLEFAAVLGVTFPAVDVESDAVIAAMNLAVRAASDLLDGPGRIVLLSNFSGLFAVHATSRNFSFLARRRSKARVDIWPVTAARPPESPLATDDRTRELSGRLIHLIERADQTAFLRALSRVYPRTVKAPESERAWQARAAG